MTARGLLVSLVLAVALRAAGLEPARLRCEYLIDPAGIDVTVPRLSWELSGEGRGLRQTTWHIRAASSPELLAAGRGDLWDSGPVASDETAHVRYAGTPLRAAQTVFWQVQVHDQDGQPSGWSPVARWSMGLLAEGDWGEACWIGLDGKIVRRELEEARWIGWPADHAGAAAPTAGRRYYRRVISLPPGREVHRIRFIYTGDREVNGFINGRELGPRDDHHRIKDQDLTFRLQPGPNVVSLIGSTPGRTVAGGGVVGVVEVEFADGPPLRFPTDESWRVSATEAPGWQLPGFDDSAWTPARDLGPVGAEPWGYVRIAEDRRLPARHLRREFDLDRPVRRATLFASGLGWSEFRLNGSRVGDHVLSPGLSEYPRRVFYVTHDVTDLLRPGRNALGAVLGNGRFYGPRSSVYAAMPTFGFPQLRLQLRLEYADGTVGTVVSDGSWRLTAEGPIVANNDFDGEEYDARRELGAWDRPGYDDSAWRPAEVVAAPTARLSAQMIEPMRVTETLRPVAVTEPRPGVHVFDLGQNMVGWARLQVEGPAGTTVTLRFAETLLPDGTPSLANLRSAQATNRYTLKGGGVETWEPSFSTQGFRYVEVRGFPGRPGPEAIVGRVVHDDLRVTGEFGSSHPLLNRIHRNITWTLRGNYKSIPLDCPQRDERQGWLGDRSEVSRGESYLFDTAAFYAIWMQDIRDVQQPSGSLSDIAPNHWPHFSDNVVWPSSAIIIPRMLFEHFGDREALAAAYEPGLRWLDYMSQWIRPDGLIDRDYWGDWCVPPEDPVLIHSRDPARQTGKAVLATSFFHHDARILAASARLLARPADEARLTALADRLARAFHTLLFRPELGQYDNGTQTSSVLALALGLVPADQRDRVVGGLVRNINEVTRGQVGTGLVGGQHLYRVLTDHGHADLAFALATRETYPSYGYMISRGATTLWELWNGDTADPWMNSGNQPMLAGDFITWLYGRLGGIQPDPDHPGFKQTILKPYPVAGLSEVRVRYDSLRGPIASEWRRDVAGNLAWTITLPPNTTALVHLPTPDPGLVSEGGRSLTGVAGLEMQPAHEGRVVVRVGSGTYHFTVRAPAAAPGEPAGAP